MNNNEKAPRSAIITRLHDINQERIRTGRLTIELAEERTMLINQWYEIERGKYERFKKLFNV